METTNLRDIDREIAETRALVEKKQAAIKEIAAKIQDVQERTKLKKAKRALSRLKRNLQDMTLQEARLSKMLEDVTTAEEVDTGIRICQ